ncbi:type II secretion system F family protein [Helicovermis profundi]|uniref:Type II secretion system F family protein n=1 Tax=Helicovermis profundi TaxID=3065157 RepID=A0AAU9E919_9FIRM|nr:type II secretion system F family protein [Clostridia bacterium S502]
MKYLLIVFIFISALLVNISIFRSIFTYSKPIEKLKYFDDFNDISTKGVTVKDRKKKNIKRFNNKKNSSFIDRYYNKEYLKLIKADLRFNPQEVVVAKFILSIIAGIISFLITKDKIIVGLICIVFFNIPKYYIFMRAKKRFKEFDDEIYDALIIISNSLKAGYSFLQSLSVVVKETNNVLSKEFSILLKELSLGKSNIDAFNSMKMRIESENLSLMINAILIQNDIGGNLSEILENISKTIMEREYIKNELKTLTAQGKLSGMIISLLPVFMSIILYLFNHEYIRTLFSTKIGIFMVILGLIGQVFGFLIIKKIVNIEM